MSRAKGNIGEDRACNHLENSGYTILERNFYSRFGEIDIIALKDDALHFIEVKSGECYDSAMQNITPKKLQRVIRTAQTYIKKNATCRDYMIDVVIVTTSEIFIVDNVTI